MKKRKIVKRRPCNKSLLDLIRKEGDPILHKKCTPVDMDKDPIDNIETVLTTVVCATKNGVGIAAPQVGINARAFVIRPMLGWCKVFFNPVIVECSKETDTQVEGCLSYPNKRELIERPLSITVDYVNEKKERLTETFKGFTARVICHELDHLDGVCLVSK